jgi:tRNA/tmRNA/rRNA uracil-C5-methylase (TrmA/RlmC/RlmD family)
LGKCEEILPKIINREKEFGNKTCLVLDPPRKGCEINVINSIIESNIDKIVYVSCKPSTLARDIGLLVGSLEYVNGQIKKVENPSLRYEISLVRPFDMFAQTKHVETLVCLARKTN